MTCFVFLCVFLLQVREWRTGVGQCDVGFVAVCSILSALFGFFRGSVTNKDNALWPNKSETRPNRSSTNILFWRVRALLLQFGAWIFSSQRWLIRRRRTASNWFVRLIDSIALSTMIRDVWNKTYSIQWTVKQASHFVCNELVFGHECSKWVTRCCWHLELTRNQKMSLEFINFASACA